MTYEELTEALVWAMRKTDFDLADWPASEQRELAEQLVRHLKASRPAPLQDGEGRTIS